MMKTAQNLLLVMTIALLTWQPAIAKANPDDYRVILTLNDGTVIAFSRVTSWATRSR